MQTFYQVFGFVAAICAGIMILTIFFLIVNGIKSLSRSFDIVKLKGFIKDGKAVNVHLTNGTSIDGLRFVGFTKNESNIPYHLQHLLVLETATEERVLLRADRVAVIEEVADVARL